MCRFYIVTLLSISIFLLWGCQTNTDQELSVKTSSFLDTKNSIQNPCEILRTNVLKPDSFRENTFYKGYVNYNLWFTINPAQIKGHEYLQINNSLLDNIVLYKIKNGIITDSIVTGDAKPFNSREFKTGMFLFSLDTSYTEYLFKINTSGMLSVPLTFLSKEDIFNNKHKPAAIYFGVILIAILFNLLLILRFRYTIYKYYFFSILALCILVFVDWGLLFEYLWPSMPVLNNYVGILYATLFLTALFADKFLELKQNAVFLHKIYILQYFIYGLAALLNLIGYYNFCIQILIYIAMLTPIINLISGIYALRYKPHLFTIYFIFAFFAYCVFSIFYILQFYGFIKVSFLSYNAVPLSTISEIIFLFLAVLERFHYIEKTQRETDKMFLEASQKNKEILLQQNELLEKHVTERTFEIQILNQELSATNEILLQRNDELSKTNECLEIQKQTLEQTLNELKQTQERLIQSEKMASLGTLIAGIAHEINNPLNFIDGGLNLLQGIKPDNELSKDKMQLSLQMIKEGVTRSSNIVKALNTYSYKGNARLQNYDIQKIIDNSLLFLKSKYIEKISIIKNYQIDKEILVYPEKLHQVFLNLLNNAIFAIGTDPIIENPVIEISTNIVEEKLKQFAYISIFNNGPLIPEDDIGKIFDPFFTTKEPGEGTGLGLSITYKIIEEHFGSIIAENTSNGVIFIIKIPIITA